MRKRKELKVVAHYMKINGEKVQIDPAKTDLPIRCKLALAEMITGQQWEIVDKNESND